MQRLLLLLSLLIIHCTAVAKADDVDHYRLDPIHTRVVFMVSHAGFSRAIGTFTQPEGTLNWVEKDPTQSQTNIGIPLKTLDLGDADWNKKILGPDYFNAEKYPFATFTSEKVSVNEKDNQQLLIEGTLELNNHKVKVVLDAKLNASKRHPLTFKQTLGFSARTTLSRKAFGMDSWPNLIGDEIEIIIETEWIKSSKAKDQKQ